MATSELRVDGMHCASCGMLIDDALEDLPGVASASTNVRRKRTRVDYDPVATDLGAIAKAIADLGYTVVEP
ncbi:MAG: heavy-metal-associated domain-containing protein [Acidimicrobiales bacterium]